jgi:hypothetical protein
MLRGTLAHHPANRIDDIRLAATVGAYDTYQIAGKVNERGINERFKASELYLAETHGFSCLTRKRLRPYLIAA